MVGSCEEVGAVVSWGGGRRVDSQVAADELDAEDWMDCRSRRSCEFPWAGGCTDPGGMAGVVTVELARVEALVEGLAECRGRSSPVG